MNVIPYQKDLPLPETSEVAETVREDIEARLQQTDTTIQSTGQVCNMSRIARKPVFGESD